MDEHHIGVAAPRDVERLSRAAPATTRTWMPVRFSNTGSRCLNSPLCSVEVVEDTVMTLSCA